MLTIKLAPKGEEIFPTTLHLEHSLVSLSKWEAHHEKAFYGREPMTNVESVSYIEMMVLNENPPEDWLERLTVPQFSSINAYINSKQTATWFREDNQAGGTSEVVTNELIYHWMIEFKIPFTPCNEWHLNQLMTLIKVRGLKQAKPKKMTRQQQAEEYRRLNAERRQKLGTTG